MEGLLPLVFRAIKKNRTRRQYECLSSSSANNNALSYNISMAEIYPQINHNHVTQFPAQSLDLDHVHHAEININHGHHHHRRRHNSVGDFGNYHHGFFQSPQMRTGVVGSSAPKQLVRFRSQRMFSCITGI